jgi:hypothetical protein
MDRLPTQPHVPAALSVLDLRRHKPAVTTLMQFLNRQTRTQMSFTTPTTVPSGMSVRVLEVDGHPPNELQDFAGEVSFVVGLDPPVLVHGTGRVDGPTVRFHEKDVDHSGKDIRVWAVRPERDGHFVAEHAAQF